MKFRSLVAIAAVSVFVAASLTAADKAADKKAKKDPLAGVKCMFSGKKVVAASATDFNGGKIYFCCTNCPKNFAKNKDKLAGKANAQLVQTGQAKQKACPISGQKLNPATKITVAGAPVCFCCNNCKGAVSKLTGDAQIDKAFGEKAFAKAFTVGKKKKN